MTIDLASLDFTKATIISRQRDHMMAGRTGKIYVPVERVSVYFDDKAAQLRQVIAMGVTVEDKGGGVRRPHPRHKFIDCRYDFIRGFCSEQNNWGQDGTEWGRYTAYDTCPFTYQDAFGFYVEAMALAATEAFKEYQGSGTFYHR